MLKLAVHLAASYFLLSLFLECGGGAEFYTLGHRLLFILIMRFSLLCRSKILGLQKSPANLPPHPTGGPGPRLLLASFISSVMLPVASSGPARPGH